MLHWDIVSAAGDAPAACAIVIPARNEAARIGTCLEHCHRSVVAAGVPARLVVLVNNATDATEAVALDWAQGRSVTLDLVRVRLGEQVAHAGAARRLAWDFGRRCVGSDGLLLTTDADSRPETSWVAANLAAASAGAALVCGRISLDAEEAAALPAGFLDAWAVETDYAEATLELVSLIDPDPVNPWPHHGQISGASLAVAAWAYDRVGGAPVVPVGEDRALAMRMREFDLPVRYAAEAHVVTSCRLDGRAPGGMASTIRHRLLDADEHCDERLEPALATCFRARLRSRLRHLWGEPRAVAGLLERLGLAAAAREQVLRQHCFGAAWAALEATLPALRRVRLERGRLAAELPLLRLLVQRARARNLAAMGRTARFAVLPGQVTSDAS